jgi:hypothetical protein
MTAHQRAGIPPEARADRALDCARRAVRGAGRGRVRLAAATGRADARRRGYARLYRQVLAALGAQVRFRLATDVVLATFFVSHLTPFGSATGTLVNARTLETEGIAARLPGQLRVRRG